MLILINAFLLYALFFSGLGQSNNTNTKFFAFLPSYATKVKQVAQGISLNINGNKRERQCKQFLLLRSAYLSTPLQIVEPLSNLIVLSLLFSSVLFLNSPQCFNTCVILTNSYICDSYASFFKVLVCLCSAASIALAIADIKIYNASSNNNYVNYEFLLVIYLSIIGMLCLISSYNFLTFYLSIELQSLSFYLLACSKSRCEFSAEAGLKYFILGAFSSAFLLFGISLIYGSTGSIYFDDVACLLQSASNFKESTLDFYSVANWDLESLNSFKQAPNYLIGLVVGLACIIISLLFKLAAVPFHMWAPDVYEGSPMSVTAFFALTAKVAALAVLARFVVMTDMLLLELLSLVTLSTLVVGTLSAMRQIKIKRLIAFSGISNVGWFLLGLCTGSLQSVILHLIVYITLNIILFSILINPHYCYESTGKSNNYKMISDLSQIYKTNSTVALALTLAFFSLGGIPFLAGFYSKYLLLNSAIQAEALTLLFVGLLSAVVSAFYYMRVVKTIYFNDINSANFSLAVPSYTNAYLIALCSFFSLLFIIYPEIISVWLMLITF